MWWQTHQIDMHGDDNGGMATTTGSAARPAKQCYPLGPAEVQGHHRVGQQLLEERHVPAPHDSTRDVAHRRSFPRLKLPVTRAITSCSASSSAPSTSRRNRSAPDPVRVVTTRPATRSGPARPSSRARQRSRARQWDAHRERRARPRGRLDVERPAVGLGDRAGDVEPQAGTGLGAAALAHPAELLEDEPLRLGARSRARGRSR